MKTSFLRTNTGPTENRNYNKAPTKTEGLEVTPESEAENDDENNPDTEEMMRLRILNNMKRMGNIMSLKESIMNITKDQINQRYDLAKMKKLTHDKADANLINLPFVNPIFANECFNTYTLAATCNSILGLVTIFTSAVVYDLEYTESYKSNWNFWFQISFLNTLTTVLLTLSIIWRVNCELVLGKAEHIYSKRDTMITSKKLKRLVIEILLNVPHPIWFLRDYKINFFNDVVTEHYTHSINDLLSVFVLIRLYHSFRLLLLKSKFNTGRAHRVCKMNGVLSNRFWTLKCIIIAYPFRAVTCMLLIGILTGGYCLRILERPLGLGNSKIEFSDYSNAVWCVIITMTTVGFGEITPTTMLGRIIGTLACIWGVFVIALMVVGVNSFMELDSGQEKSFIIYQRLQFKQGFKLLAVNVLKSALKLKMMIRRNDDNENNRVPIQRSEYKRNIIAFQKARIQTEILYSLNTPERKIEDKINMCHSLGQRDLLSAQEIYKKLNELQMLAMEKAREKDGT